MTPIQQLYLGLGAKKKTYMDDVFSTDVWLGSASAKTITSGIDLSGDGGMLWIKNRGDGGEGHLIFDTERGSSKRIYTNNDGIELTNASGYVNSFTTSGYTIGSQDGVNKLNIDHAGWSFKKSKGFFDVVTYTGNGSNRTIAHSLGSIPGFYMIKRTDTSADWVCFHKEFITGNHYMVLNSNAAMVSESDVAQNTRPTSSVFSVGTDSKVNADGGTYVCYLFAGGESTAATARSVDFDGSDDELFENSTDSVLRNWFDQAFTVEYWVKADGLASGGGGGTNAVGVSTLGTSNLSWSFGPNNIGQVRFSYWTGSSETAILPSEKITVGQWYHLAFVHNGSNNCKIFINGKLGKEATISNGSANAGDMCIGQVQSTQFNGKISNLRITHQALYTTSFKPPTQPLTTTSQGATASNVKLLCCNNSSITGSTVSPSGMGNNGSPTASTDSPFDDPDAFKFGENGDENIIKTGSYIGNGDSTGPEINLGWEPQYLLLKNADEAEQWQLFDSMRGIPTGGNDEKLMPSLSSAVSTAANIIDLTPTGFKLKTSDTDYNGNNDKLIYIAIRRPDGYVGKPADAGTDVFAMDTGSSSTYIPTFDSGFPVDFGFYRIPTQTHDFTIGARLTGTKYMLTNANNSEADNSYHLWDSNVGWAKGHNSSHQSWMWKRHAGFDVVTYTGNGTFGHVVNHSMNKIPEMIWIKERDNSVNWYVNHIALTGGGSYASWRGALKLNSTAATWESANILGGASTSSTFTVGGDNDANQDGDNYLALLFASVNGISKVGSYTGNGSNTGPSISLGFQPRFIIIKAVSQTGPWRVLDSVRGMGSGNDKSLRLESTAAQVTDFDWLDATSTGFDIKTSDGEANASGALYLYYAHA